MERKNAKSRHQSFGVLYRRNIRTEVHSACRRSGGTRCGGSVVGNESIIIEHTAIDLLYVVHSIRHVMTLCVVVGAICNGRKPCAIRARGILDPNGWMGGMPPVNPLPSRVDVVPPPPLRPTHSHV